MREVFELVQRHKLKPSELVLNSGSCGEPTTAILVVRAKTSESRRDGAEALTKSGLVNVIGAGLTEDGNLVAMDFTVPEHRVEETIRHAIRLGIRKTHYFVPLPEADARLLLKLAESGGLGGELKKIAATSLKETAADGNEFLKLAAEPGLNGVAVSSATRTKLVNALAGKAVMSDAVAAAKLLHALENGVTARVFTFK